MLPAIELDDLLLPWGLTMEQAATRLANLTQYPSYGGWPNLRVACQRAYGLATTEANLRGPAPDRPVMQVSYELAAGSLPVVLGTAAPWLPTLTQQFGPLTEGQPYPEARGHAGSVVWAGHWQLPQLRVSLSVFGGLRESPGGPVLAGLFIDWEDELTAAAPWLPQAQAEAAALAAVASQGRALLTVTLGYVIKAAKKPASSREAEPAALRWAQRALYSPQLHETPAHWPLAEGQVLLWELPGSAGWALSTRHDTVQLPAAAAPPIELVTLKPAKGSGAMYLRVGDLTFSDVYKSPALPRLADYLATLPGVAVSRTEDYDC